MRTRFVAALLVVLIFPAALFMTALVLRTLQPLEFEPARSAQQLVMWYAGRVWTLWMLLLGLPFIVLVTGSGTLLRGWNREVTLGQAARQLFATTRANFSALLLAATTLAASVILVIVILHMAAN